MMLEMPPMCQQYILEYFGSFIIQLVPIDFGFCSYATEENI